MTTETLSKIKITVVTVAGILGGVWGIIEGYDKITERIDETVKAKVMEHSGPLIKKNIAFTLDSISKAKKMSFREGLATEFSVPKQDIIPVMGTWYKSEKDIMAIGLKYDLKNEELYYIGVDKRRHRPFKDTTGHYFYYDVNHKKDWCY